MKTGFQKFLYWLPAILFMILIFYLSSRPVSGWIRSLPVIIGFKVAHMIEFGLLFYLFRSAILETMTLKRWEVFVLSLILTVLYGISDELHQLFVPYRTATLIDVFADGVGAVVVQVGINIRSKQRT